MDLTTTSGIVKIGLVFITFFTIPVYSEKCSKKELFSSTTYIDCETSCCGSSYDRYCCPKWSKYHTAGVVISCVIGLGICIACVCCCMRRRAAAGMVISQQVPIQQTVFQPNMMTTVPGQIIQVQPVASPYIINQQPCFTQATQPNMVPNPQVSTIASTHVHTTFNESEPPPYEDLHVSRRTEKPHLYEKTDFKYRDNSMYDEVNVNTNTVRDNFEESDEESFESSESNPRYAVGN